MVRSSSLFSQVLGLVSRYEFEQDVRAVKADRHAKGFRSWSQFVAMIFCQLAQAQSLREITNGLRCCVGKLNHLGVQEAPKRSLADLGNSYAVVQQMRLVPFQLMDVAKLGAAAAARLLPLGLTIFSLDELLVRLFKILF